MQVVIKQLYQEIGVRESAAANLQDVMERIGYQARIHAQIEQFKYESKQFQKAVEILDANR